MNSDDRLTEIKAHDYSSGIPVAEAIRIALWDRPWLIAEVERLRQRDADIMIVFDQNNAYYAELTALRTALSAIASSDFASAHSKRIAREALDVR